MSETATRIIGSGIVAAGGVIAVAIGSLPQANDFGAGCGGVAMVAGGLLFAYDWVTSQRGGE